MLENKWILKITKYLVRKGVKLQQICIGYKTVRSLKLLSRDRRWPINVMITIASYAPSPSLVVVFALRYNVE